MKTPLVLALLLAVVVTAPSALAVDPVDPVDIVEVDAIDCGNIFTHGVVYVALCLAYATVGVVDAVACYGWRLVWGQTAPCLV